VEVEEKNE